MRTLFLVLLLCLTALPARAQEGPIFPKVVPNPAGRNGYEELVRAVDVLRASRLLAKAENRQGEGGTLAYRRAVLQEKPVVEALRLVRQGLAKPVFSPRTQVSATSTFTEFSGFRRIARLLQIQQYVLLADGRTREAIDAARVGLRFGSAIQTDTLLSGLVGLAVNALAITPLSSHLDQLSARDCELLFQVCQEWAQQPDPTLRIMEAEQRFSRKSLEEMLEMLRKGVPAAPDEELDPETRQLQRDLPKTPQELEQLQRQSLVKIDRYYQDLFTELRKPYWQRRLEEPEDDGSIVSRLTALQVPVFRSGMTAYTRDQARIRLLACHAAVLRYRWEHDRLPGSLAELNLRELAEDPFTGEPLRYQVTGSRYRLYSVGPEAPPEDPRTVEGRQPVSIVPGDF